MEYIEAKSIVSGYAEKNSWFGVNYNMNIYKGCSHGCIYCDSRSECYGIEDFDRVRAKANSTDIIRRELKGKKRKGVVGTGSMSDPYNPFEEKLMLTRSALEQIDNFNFGISIATKSPLITRDIDLLKKIKSHSPVIIKTTITTLDDKLCKKIETNVEPSSYRFEAIKELSLNGIFSGILLMPILPFVNDNEENIIGIVERASEVGAKFIFAYGMGVTLRQNQRDYYYMQLNKIFNNRNLVKMYIDNFGQQYGCSSLKAKKLCETLKIYCEKYGILYKMEDIIDAYKKEYIVEQIKLF